MKTSYLVQALRNSATPAARLAAWQSPGYGNRPALKGNLATLKVTEYRGDTIAARRKSILQSTGPALSSPEAECPLLWLSGTKDPLLADWTAGRDFLDHRGWYCDNYESDTYETYAVTLKAFPRLMFYAVLLDEGLRVELNDWQEIDFSDCESDYDGSEARKDTAKEIIRSNDSSTAKEAEESREFYRKDEVENDIEENKETLKTLRQEIRELAHELKTLCPSAMALDYPAAGKALRESLKNLLGERRELMESNRELAASL